MAYCRWSSDGFRCDLYCYESNEGFITHVAAYRWSWHPWMSPYSDSAVAVFTGEHNDEEKKILGERYGRLSEAYNFTADDIKQVPIDLPYAGETFIDDEVIDMHDRCMELRKLGYSVPKWVTDNMMEEALLSAGLTPIES